MPSTQSTLKAALERARAQGVGGSVLEQALAGFQDQQADQGPSFGDILGETGLGKAFKSVVPRGVRNVAGTGLQVALSGKRALSVIPGVDLTEFEDKGPFDELLDILFAPASIVPAGAGLRIGRGLAQAGPVGRVAAGLFEPLLLNTPFKSAIPAFGARLVAETAGAVAAEKLSTLALERLPESTPFPIQIGVMLAAALPGPVAARAIGFGRGLKRAKIDLTPEEIVEARALHSAAQEMRSSAVDTQAQGVEYRKAPITQENEDAVGNMLDRIARPETVSQVRTMVSNRLNKVPEMVAKSPSRFARLGRLINPRSGRDRFGQNIAAQWSNYTGAELHNINVAAIGLRDTTDLLFGKTFERIAPLLTPKFGTDAERLTDLQRYWNIYQQAENHGALGTLLVENFDLFELNKRQLKMLEAMDDTLENDLRLLKDEFGVEIDRAPGFYATHNLDFVDEVGSSLSATAASIRFSRELGSARGFQMPRTFKNFIEMSKASESAADPEAWARQMDRAISSARGDAEEVARLQALKKSGIRFGPAQSDFEANFAGRLGESAALRGEKGAQQSAKAFGAVTEAEVKRIMNQDVNPILQTVAQFASIPRSLILRFDASVIGVQGMGGVIMGNGLEFGTKYFQRDFIKSLTHDGYLRWAMANADEIEDQILHGAVFSQEHINLVKAESANDIITSPLFVNKNEVIDPDTSLPVRMGGDKAMTSRGSNINLAGRAVKVLDDVQFGRGLGMMKFETNKFYIDWIRAAQKGDNDWMKGVSHPFISGWLARNADAPLDEVKRAVNEFTNNLFGGRNRAELGRSKMHDIVESLFFLTPGFTRGTLSIVRNIGKGGLEGALARDFAIRGMLIAGGLVTVMTVAANGAVNGELVLPNVLDPRQDNWMDVPLPGGRTIRPLSRFRSVAKLGFDAVNNWATMNPIEAVKVTSEDTLRWWSYRQSALVSNLAGDPVGEIGETIGLDTGNRFARGISLKDLVSNPSTDVGADLVDLVFANVPISLQKAHEIAVANQGVTPQSLKDSMIAIGSEFLGVGTFGPSGLERQVAGRTAELAVEAGVPEDVVDLLKRRGRSSVNAKDSAGTFILDREQRSAIVSQAAADLGISEEVVRRGGTRSQRERQAAVGAMENQQLDSFFGGMKLATDLYRNGNAETGQPGVLQLESGVSQGIISFEQFSQMLTDLRLQRAAAKEVIEQVSPAATAFLQTPKHLKSQNSKDVLFDAISAEAFGQSFYDSDTLTFDFDARNAHFDRLEAKYGVVFDEWLERADSKKFPLELERDDAFDRMANYFDVGDQIWQAVTGGLLGDSEREFDAQLRQLMPDADPGTITLVLQAIKGKIPAIAEARRLTTELRQVLRLSDAQLERDVTKWLGNTPILAQ